MDTSSTVVGLSNENGTPLEHPPTQLTSALKDLIRPLLRSRDVSVSSIVGSIAESVTFPAQGPAAFSITLVLKGAGRTLIDGIEPLEMASGTAIVFWSDGPVSGLDHIDGGKPIEAVDIRLHPAYLTSTVGSMVDAIRNALIVNRSHPAGKAFLVGVPLSAELFDIARDILDCTIREASLRELYMRAKALEALALTLSILSREVSATVRLTDKDLQRLDRARHLMETAYADPWTIETLARTVGLSETKLKAGFREVIGKSVRTYLRDVRMDHAARLLREGKSVTEVALACGYGNLSYFSKAFFNAKGVAPRRLLTKSR